MVFCFLIFGLDSTQVIDVAANLTKSGCMLCWWSASLHNQVECVWLILPVGTPSFSACVLFRGLLLFRITWLVRICLPVCVSVSSAENFCCCGATGKKSVWFENRSAALKAHCRQHCLCRLIFYSEPPSNHQDVWGKWCVVFAAVCINVVCGFSVNHVSCLLTLSVCLNIEPQILL